MSASFCNVALPVPLRTTFTYAVPEPLRAAVQPGSRVLVPFRNRALIGVVTDFVETAPEGTRVREVARVLGFVPALPRKLLELAEWIASYYLAPLGEVFRTMLPPLTELRAQRRILLTEAGRAAAENLDSGASTHGLTTLEVAFLAKLQKKKGLAPFAWSEKMGLPGATRQKLERLGLIEILERKGRRSRDRDGTKRKRRSGCCCRPSEDHCPSLSC